MWFNDDGRVNKKCHSREHHRETVNGKKWNYFHNVTIKLEEKLKKIVCKLKINSSSCFFFRGDFDRTLDSELLWSMSWISACDSSEKLSTALNTVNNSVIDHHPINWNICRDIANSEHIQSIECESKLKSFSIIFLCFIVYSESNFEASWDLKWQQLPRIDLNT